jgi:hypothetical protein
VRLASVPGASHDALQRAVNLDMAALIADGPDSEQAIRWLKTHGRSSLVILDYLAAIFAESERYADAREVDALITATYPKSSGAGDCERKIRAARTIGAVYPGREVEELEKLRREEQPCRVLAEAHLCDSACSSRPIKNVRDAKSQILMRCLPHLRNAPQDGPAVFLLAAYKAWPRSGASWHEWIEVAELAERAVPLPDSVELCLDALLHAKQASPCEARSSITSIVGRMRAIPKIPLDQDRLGSLASTACN